MICLVAVERADQCQRLGTGRGLAVLRLLETASAMAPALGVDDTVFVLGIGGIGLIPVAQQGAPELAEQRWHMPVLA